MKVMEDNMAKKLFLHQSTHNDLDDILNFYQNNKHKDISGRDKIVMEARVKEGAVTTLKDENGDIKAISISYPVVVDDENGDEIHKWTEIGSTHILMGGMGLFDILVGSQILNAFLLSPPEERFVIEIKKNNDHSFHVFRKMGCVDFEPTEDMMEAVYSTLAPEDIGNVDWLHCGAEIIPELAQRFLDRIDNPTIVNKETNEEFELDISKSPLSKHFIPVLEQLAKHDYGMSHNPDMEQKLAHIQKKLINNHKKP